METTLHSSREANYGRDRVSLPVPGVDLGIVIDILNDQGLSDDEIADRIATLNAVLELPVPTSTGILSIVDTPMPVSTSTPAPTLVVLEPTVVAPTPIVPPIPTKTKPPPDDPNLPAPALALTVSMATYDDNDLSGTVTLNDGLRYQFQFTNTGNTTLDNIFVTDTSFGIPVTCPATSLAPGATMLCTTSAPHVVTLAESNAGIVTMTGFASGDYGGSSFTRTVSLDTTVTQNPSIQMVKSLASFDDNDSSGSITQGDGLWYQFDLTNTGNVTVTNLGATDDSFGLPVTCPPVSLAPGNLVICNTTSAHIVSAAEATAGEVSNTATASVDFDAATYSDSDTLVIPLSIQLIKSLASYDDNDTSGTITLGDDLWYQFEATNIGPLTLNNISLTDDTFGIPVTCPSTSLASGAAMTCTADSAHTVTLAEADAGNVQNVATVTGDPPAGPTVLDTSTLDTPLTQNTALSIAKSASPRTPPIDTPGKVIDYTFIVSNTGNVTVSGPITIDDDKATDEICPVGDIVPGNSISCSASYTVTQADLDSGSVTNTAFATGADPGGNPVASAPDTVTILTAQTPTIQIVKTMASYGDLDGSNSITLGDELWYRFNLSNLGNVTLSPVSVTDDSFGIPVTCPVTFLAPGAAMLCAADAAHTITLVEANAGQITNTATATGGLNGTPYTASDTITTPISQNPALALTKSAVPVTYDTLGQVITYTYTIENSGDVTLAGPFTVSDDKQGTLTDCAIGPLDPTGTTTCTSAHTVTQADIDAGSITNTATVSGNGVTSGPDSLTVNAVQTPALALTKSGNPLTYASVGQGITYTYILRNSGNVTLNGPFTITDDKTGTVDPCGAGPLAPGATTNCSAIYSTTQFDLDLGSLTNTATGSTMYAGSPVASNPDSVTATAVQSPSYTISKTVTDVGGDGPGGHADQAGDVISYQIALFNTGNVSLIGATASDPLLGALTGPTESGTTDGILGVGEIWTYTGAYTVTVADIESDGGGDGFIENTASATTTFLPIPQTSSVSVPVDQLPALTLTKSADLGSYDTVGQVITYTYTIENSGNITLAGPFTVDDDRQGTLTDCAAGPLAPTITTTCTSTHTVTQADIDAGDITNTATVTGNGVTSGPDSVTITATQNPALTLTKSADLGSYDTVGQVITYTYTIENSGNVTLAGPFTVDDDRQGTLTDCAVGPLAPTVTTTCSSTHTVTQADIDAGGITNTATVSGNSVTSAPDSVTVNAVQSPALTLTKSADLGNYDTAGQVITYTYTIENSGNVTLAGPFTVSDDIQGVLTDCAAGPLAPTGTTTCTSAHTVTQADVDAGGITNTATVSGNSLTSPPDVVTVTAIQTPAMTVVKSSVTAGLSAPGTVTYDYLVTNTGNVTLTGISLADDNDNDDMSCPSTTLAVGANMSCTATHTFTQAELDAGGNLSNNVTASSNEALDALDSLNIPITQTPSMTVAKSSVTASLSVPGTVTYDYLVTNTGNVTLTGIGLADDNDNDDMSCPATTLAVGANMSCTATHTFTQVELDAGGVLSNTVTADSTELAADTDTLNIPITQTPAIQVVKSSTTTDVTAAGQIVPYSFVVTNVGNITLSGITVGDPACDAPPAYQSGDTDTDTLLDLSESWTYSCSRTTTQGEMDAGGNLTNTVTADSNESGSDTDVLNIPITQTPAIQVAKSSTTTDVIAAGQIVPYSFVVTNTGNITLSGITVGDPACDAPPAYQSGDTDTDTLLDLSETWTYSCSRTTTQAEMDAGGNLSNTVTADSTESTADTDTLDIPITQTPVIQVVKNSTTTDITAAGQVVPYSFAVTNTGNITLSGITVSDPSCDAAPAYQSGDTGTDTLLDLAETWTYTCSRTTTQAEMDAGGNLSNTVTVDSTESSADTDTLDIPVTQTPVIQVVKSSITTDITAAGQIVPYSFAVTNTGNITLSGITVGDPACDAPPAYQSGDTNTDTLLDLSENWTYTCDRTVTQAEMDAGGNLSNTVTADSTESSADTDTLNIPITQSPAIQVVKSSTTTDVTAAGQVVPYSFAITNVGNITLSGITVNDPNCDAVPAYQNGDTDTDTLLDLSETWTYSCSRSVIQAEMDAGGTLSNTVTADSTESTADTDTLDIPITQTPVIQVVKSSTTTDITAAGQIAPYSFAVTNTGNITLSGITVGDPACDVAPAYQSGDTDTDTLLDLSETWTYTCSRTTTQAEMDAGGNLSNTITVDSNESGADTDTLNIPITQTPAIQIVKSLASYDDNDLNAIISQGDNLWYQFDVSNPGNVTLTSMSVSDDTFAIPVTCPVAILAPGDATTCTADSFYAVNTADAAAGAVSNTATATGYLGVTPYVESDTLSTTIVTISPAFLSGQVRDDTDGDGNLGDSDAGLANVRIELDNGVCTLGVNCASVLTDSNGIFTFSSLPDGGYTLVETDLVDYLSTADSDPPNDNQIDVIISGSTNSSGHVFLDTANPLSCSAPDPVNGFVVSTDPSNGQTDVPISTTTLTVTFDQPMKTSGGGNVLNRGEFDNNIDNLTLGGHVDILSVSYDPITYTATLILDTGDPEWQPGSQFRLRVNSGIRNACDVNQGVDVDIFFTTETVISGQVLNIEDSEGIYGVTVELTGASCGGSCATTTTDLDGYFHFYGFTPGDYTLLQTNLPGYISESDSDPPNDDQIALTLPAGSNSTGHTFVDRPATCIPPGVTSTIPADGATGVSLGTSTLTVTFDQPMITYGGGNVIDIGSYDNDIDNITQGGNVDILAASYNPNTYTATLTIDTSDLQWQPGSQFRLRIKDSLKNACDVKMAANVDVFFTTAAFVSGQVLNNLDGDGIYGVLVELTGASCGGSCGTTTTDVNGDFVFTGLSAGSYTLLQTNLPGYNSVSDSNPPNDDQVNLTLPAGSNSTGHLFTDTPGACAAPGVVSTNPGNGVSGISLSTSTLTVTFDQPMITYGGGSVLDKGNFDNNIDNETLGGDVPIVGVSYDPNTYTATLTIDTSDKDWLPGSQFRLRIKDGLKNACDVKMAAQVDVFFTTDLVISGQVRNDLDGDGDLSDLDPGISAVSIELYDGACTLGSTCLTTVTNSGGFFTLSDLTPGSYTLYETDPGGYVSTADSDGGNDNQIAINLVAGANSIGNKFLDKVGP